MNESAHRSKDLPHTEMSARLIRRHLLEGWGGLLLFAALGTMLEALLAFKVSAYVRADQETLRLMWRLAHSHGALLALVHLAFAFTVSRLDERVMPQPLGQISGCLTAASLLIPGGFFLGGATATDGDPGAAIALVPVGAVLLLLGVGRLLLCLMSIRSR